MRQSVKWGVDSAATVTEALFQCVQKQYGSPSFWGRYLKTIPQTSTGMTKEEIQFLQSKGIKVLPIYNNFNEAKGNNKGKVAAGNAVFLAKQLGIPRDTMIFANIEDSFTVDEAWLRGWTDAFFTTGYRPGFYASPERGSFSEAYCKAAAIDPKISSQSVIWAQDPLLKPTTSRRAPTFQPSKLPCKANIWFWQYGKDAEKCSINTNLAQEKALQYLS